MTEKLDVKAIIKSCECGEVHMCIPQTTITLAFLGHPHITVAKGHIDTFQFNKAYLREVSSGVLDEFKFPSVVVDFEKELEHGWGIPTYDCDKKINGWKWDASVDDHAAQPITIRAWVG